MKNYLKKLFSKNAKIKKAAGVFLVLIGLAALLTPFTPGSWLIFVGLGLLGIHFLSWDKIIKSWFRNKKSGL